MKMAVETFYAVCEEADLPISHSEKKIMEEVGGDPERFIQVCEHRRVPITKNEKFFLKWIPRLDDSRYVWTEKMDICLEKARKISKWNKAGI